MAVRLRGRPDALDPAFGQRLMRQARGVGSPIGCASSARWLVQTSNVYAASDVLLLASRAETYGLVVTEALARGLPVVAMSVGGLPEAVGHSPEGTRPGCWCLRATRRRSQVPCGHG